MRQIEKQIFEQLDTIYFEQLQIGMNQYYWDVVEGKELEYLNLLKFLLEMNDENKVYVDFYYNRLNPMEKIKLEEKLNPKDQIILHRLLDKYNQTDSIFFECEERWIPFFLHLSYRELLFQTFYFTNPKVTVWTNYSGKFILFTSDEKVRQLVLKKVGECGIKIDENY